MVLIPGGYAPGPRENAYLALVLVLVLFGWRRTLTMRSTHGPMMKPPRMATSGAVNMLPVLLIDFWVSRHVFGGLTAKFARASVGVAGAQLH